MEYNDVDSGALSHKVENTFGSFPIYIPTIDTRHPPRAPPNDISQEYPFKCSDFSSHYARMTSERIN